MLSPKSYPPQRAVALILEHCAVLARLDSRRCPPFARVEAVIGHDLAHVLVHGLARRMRQPA